MFRRPRHNAILHVLKSLDAELFRQTECFFGGGTAIALELDEYRESEDVDFLCSSRQGYLRLRQEVFGVGLDALFRSGSGIKTLRETRTDQYSVRTVLEVAGIPIRFEILSEGRIDLAGDDRDGRSPVPVLSRAHMYAEKLLANTDRWADPAVMNRDIIDLSMMISRWGGIPDEAWRLARAVYGEAADRAFRGAVGRIRNPGWLRTCMENMGIDRDLASEILGPHGGPELEDRGRKNSDSESYDGF